MSQHERTMEELRIELSNLRDDLAVIESSAIFAANSVDDTDALKAIRNRIADLEAALEREYER